MTKVVLAMYLGLSSLLLVGLISPQRALSSAQPQPCPAVGVASPTATDVETSQRLLGQIEISQAPPGAAQMRAVQIVLAPGDATEPFVTQGDVLVVVQDGTVTINADAALISAPPEPNPSGVAIQEPTVTPAAARDVAVTEGEQIALADSVAAQLRNETAVQVRLLLVTLAPGA